MLLLFHLFALFLLVLLGFYVFVANPRNRAHQTFAAFISILAFWTVKDLIFWNFYDEKIGAGWWASSSFIVALLMQCALVVFSWVFPENARTPRKRASIIFAPGLILIPAAGGGLLWHKVSLQNGIFIIDLAPLAYAFVLYVYFIFFYGAALLYKKYRKYRGTQKGQQIGAILWAAAITGILKTLANIILPFYGIYYFLPFSAIFVLPGVLIYAYAISNFKLFSLQTALDQFRLFPIAYKIALSIASVAILSFLLFQIPIVWWAFQDGMSLEAWRRYLVFSIISALVPNLLLVLLIVRTISRPLQKITLAAVQVTKGKYGTEVELRKSNDEIGLLANSFNEMSRKMSSDIEQLQKLNEQLIRTEKLAAMGTLAAGVAHEVNNPLASISSLIQIMQSNSGSDEKTGDNLRLISTQIQRISQITRDMMDFARVRPSARNPVNINEILEVSLRLASFDKAFQKLRLKKIFDDDLPKVYADSDQMQQVFLNLLLNARDAMPDGGAISIKTFKQENEIIIELEDSGIGIGNNDRKKIFDPFFTTKPAGKGTGLGLAVCYGIITAHNGKIEVFSNENGGTSFSICLPINEKTAD
ncbi:MAG: HAMP domain-containing protein [Pyrinomonadaceae bacterium]|nr:HAMP domain-containing protein [Pyrinomonadaceae bacterium]